MIWSASNDVNMKFQDYREEPNASFSMVKFSVLLFVHKLPAVIKKEHD